MTRAEAWLQHVANALVGGTGLVYGWMRYFAEPADEFAIVNHPWQPDLQHLHILSAPLLVFASGLIWRDHVWKRVKAGFRPRRKLGLALFGLLLPMVVSGYLVQTASDETWQRIWIWTHGLTSVGWLVAYLAHQVSPKRSAASSAPGARG
ncbi:MAG: hypothetical protein AAF682_30925 [Planctomycetota bacterium]